MVTIVTRVKHCKICSVTSPRRDLARVRWQRTGYNDSGVSKLKEDVGEFIDNEDTESDSEEDDEDENGSKDQGTKTNSQTNARSKMAKTIKTPC